MIPYEHYANNNTIICLLSFVTTIVIQKQAFARYVGTHKSDPETICKHYYRKLRKDRAHKRHNLPELSSTHYWLQNRF